MKTKLSSSVIGLILNKEKLPKENMACCDIWELKVVCGWL
jgi:hypothetical protein